MSQTNSTEANEGMAALGAQLQPAISKARRILMKTNQFRSVAKVVFGSLMLLTLLGANVAGQNTLTNGLVAYYPFNGHANDESGNGRHGTIVGALPLTEDRFGRPGHAYSFDADNHIMVPGTQGLHLQSGLSLCAWFRTTNYGLQNIMMSKHFGGYRNGYFLALENSGELGLSVGEARHFTASVYDPDLFDGQWHHVVGTYDGAVGQVYVNGVLRAQGNENPAPLNDANVIIGRVNTGAAFQGVLDEVRIYSRPLSEAEVQLLFQVRPTGPPVIYAATSQLTNYTGKSTGIEPFTYGSFPLNYQWLFNSAALPGAPNTTLQLTNLTLGHSGTYSLTVSNAYGVTNKDLLVLTVVDSAPFLLNQPINQWKRFGTTVIFEASADGSWPLSYQWQFEGNAIEGATNCTLSFTFSDTNQIGRYALVASNAFGSATSSVANLILRQALLVSTNSPDSQPPYQTWATAAQTIQAAVDAALAGDLVLVTNGVYDTGGTNGNRVQITNAITLQSVNGPDVTVIHGMGEVRCVNLGSNAVLSGFTLTNGWAGDYGQGGGVWSEASGVVTNCNLTGNRALQGGGASGGTLNNCILTGNAVESGAYYESMGGGAYHSTLHNCVLTNNIASGFLWLFGGGMGWWEYTVGIGGGVAESILHNCTLTGNSATDGGGGASWSALNNCIAYYNSGGGNYYCSTFNYSCTYPMPADGVGNITNAPIFVNPAAGDFRLAFGSPGIDAGTNLSAIITNDLAGNPRPLDGDGDGAAAFDMGAYEFEWRTAVPAAWLAGRGLATNDYATLAQDHDNDGIPTYLEYVAGTCPTNSNSCFHISGVGATTSNSVAALQASTVINRLYTLEFCTDLALRNWQPVSGQTDIPGNGDVLNFSDPNAIPPRFYRVTVRLP